MSNVNRVRIFIERNGRRLYYQRMAEASPINGRAMVTPQFVGEMQRGVLFTPESAAQFLKELRAKNWAAHSVDFEGRVDTIQVPKDPARQQPKDRQPVVVDGILIRPAGHPEFGECWCVRFPATSMETIYGTTPEDVHAKLTQFPQLVPHAERFEEPDLPLSQFRKAVRPIVEDIRRQNLGIPPGSFIRPGDQR